MKNRPIMRMMSRAKARIVIFSNEYPLLGPIFWTLAAQYMITQVIVASAFIGGYDWKNNFISDLGNTACGQYADLYVCSPLHPLMNLSFIVFGITMALGSLLIFTEFKQTKLSLVGFTLMSLAGFGTVIVGLFPENTVEQAHMIGAFLGLGVGNISILVLVFALRGMRKIFKIYSFVSAIVSLTAFILFLTGIYLGIGRGGMERVISYPFAVWMILFGVYMLAVRIRVRRNKRR